MAATMKPIRFDAQARALLVSQLQRYFSKELQQEIGQFDAEFLLDFVSETLGAHYYNQGLRDAQAALSAKMDDIQDAFYALEQPTDASR